MMIMMMIAVSVIMTIPRTTKLLTTDLPLLVRCVVVTITTEWALPLGALSVIGLGVLIPLLLKPGVDAFNASVNEVEFQPPPTPKKGTRNRSIIK